MAFSRPDRLRKDDSVSEVFLSYSSEPEADLSERTSRRPRTGERVQRNGVASAADPILATIDGTPILRASNRVGFLGKKGGPDAKDN